MISATPEWYARWQGCILWEAVHTICEPCRRTSLSRHEFHSLPAVCGWIYGGPVCGADGCIRGRRAFRESGGNPPRAGEQPRIKVAIDEALKCKETGEEKTIVFGLTGTGYFDMMAYEKFHNKEMTDYIPTDEDLKKGFDGIPRFPGNMQ